MKSVIALVIAMTIFSNIADASLVVCDWKKIQGNPDGTYTYSKELNLCVGHLVYNQTADNQRIDDLTGAIAELNLALETSDAQAKIWQATSTEMNAKINEVKAQDKSNRWISFGLGVLAGSALLYGASRLTR